MRSMRNDLTKTAQAATEPEMVDFSDFEDFDEKCVKSSLD